MGDYHTWAMRYVC